LKSNYYTCLGVLQGADHVVIQAAYKALIRVYHPDVHQGDKSYATLRTTEINKAWSVLSNKSTRAAYDKTIEPVSDPFKADFKDENMSYESEKFSSIIKKEWDYAVEFFPDLTQLYRDLAQIDPALSMVFQAKIVEDKTYTEASVFSDYLQTQYLKEKFGDDASLQKLALLAIRNGERSFAVELNKSLKRLGINSKEAILRKLSSSYTDFAINFYHIASLRKYLSDDAVKEWSARCDMAEVNSRAPKQKDNTARDNHRWNVPPEEVRSNTAQNNSLNAKGEYRWKVEPEDLPDYEKSQEKSSIKIYIVAASIFAILIFMIQYLQMN
jgi:curved DNA-binding protein CbpA